MTTDDLYPGVERYQIPEDHFANLKMLLDRILPIEKAFGEAFHVTSGYRTWQIHKEIYQRLNDQRVISGKSELPIPIHSKHLTGQAVDVFDPDDNLKIFLLDHVDLLEDNKIWCENFDYCPRWCHMQSVAPLTGDRFFKPY